MTLYVSIQIYQSQHIFVTSVPNIICAKPFELWVSVWGRNPLKVGAKVVFREGAYIWIQMN